MSNVGKARIEFEADATNVTDELLAKMAKALDRIADYFEKSYARMEADAQSSMDKVGQAAEQAATTVSKSNAKAASSFDDVGTAASKAGQAASSEMSDSMADVAKAASEAGASASDSLSDVAGAASESGAAASSAMAASMADITQAAASAGAAATDSLSDLGGAASQSGAAASSAVAGSMSDISASAAGAFSSVSASAADAAAGVATSAANMSSSMTSAMSDISSTSAGAEGAVGGIGGALGGLSKKAIPVAAGLAGVAGAGATLQAGFGKLTSIEDTTASLGIILDDATAAQDLMAQLQTDNQATPYMFDAYAAAGKTLAAFGADLEGIPEQVSALGEAAAASGGGQEVFDQMARASGQAMATGKMSLDTINQLAVGGVQGLQILANHFDVPTDEMQKMISGGMVPAQEAMDILTQGILEGSDGIAGSTNAMSGVMQEMSETTSGSMTSLLAAFNNLAAAGIEPLVPIITMIADGLTDFAYIIIDLINGEADLPGWLQIVLQVLEPLAVAVGTAVTVWAAWTGAVKAWTFATTVATAVQKGFNAAVKANKLMLIVSAIAGVVAALTWFFTKTALGQKIWQGLMDALGAAWEWLQGAFAGVWSTISDAAVAAFEWISDAWNTMWSFLQSAWDTVGQPIIDFIVAAFNLWWEGVQLYFRLLGAAWEVLWTGLRMAWDAVGQPVVDFIVSAFQLWWDGIKIIFGWLQAGWDLLWAGVKAVYDAVIAPVVRWVVDRFNDLKAGVGAALDLVKSAVQSVADRVAEFYGTYVQPMVDRVIRGFDRIRDTLIGWKDRIIGIFSGAGSWLWDAGKNIVQGLIDGIKSLAGTIGNAFLNTIPGWIKDPFKRALGIASPSKLFADYGRNIGEGLISGIKGMQGQVAASMGGLTSTAAAAGDELRDAFHGGDSGYAALGSVIGDQLAQQAMDVTAGAGQVAAPVVAAGDEVGAAFEGRDMGYAATGALIGDDAAVQALDVSAQIGDAFAAAGAGIDAAKTGIIDPALAGMSGNLASLGAAAAVQGTAITTALNTAGAGVANAKTTLVDPALAGMQAGLAQTALTTQQQMLGLALPAMQSAGSGIAAVQTGTVDPALAGMRGAVGNTQSAFASGTAGINAEFNKVREGVAAPTRYAIGPVFNDGLVGMWNGVSDMVGLKKMSPHPINFWKGGILPGYTPGRDPFTFVEPRTGMSIGLSGGESIMRPEWTKAVGPAGVHAMNSVARSEGAAGVHRMLEHAHLGGFNSGGIVGSMEAFVGKHWPSLLQSGKAYSGLRFTDNGYHSKGMAADFSNGGNAGTPEMKALANVIFRNFAGQTLELIHWPLAGFQNLNNGRPFGYNSGTNEQHRNHVHWAIPAPLQAAGIELDMAGGAVTVDPREIVESMIGPDLERVKGVASGFRGAGGAVDALPSKVHDAMVKPMIDTLVKAFEEFGGNPGGADVGRWRPLAMQALARMGFDPAQHIDAMMQQIQIESGGVPNVVNNWDSNAIAGHPSGGLLQVIEPTYRRIRNAYPDAFKGLPDDRMHPLTNLTAGVGAVTMDWGGPASRWPTRGGYDQGGIANGMGFLQKKIVDPERVLNPAQTKAFEAWMAAGQRFDEINDLVTSVQAMQLDSPEVMADDIGRRVAQWIGDEPADGSLRALAAALQSGVEWERVTQGMARSAEAWANGDWVRVADDKRLATPDEMRRQVEGNFLSELADEFGGLIGLKGLLPAPDIVGETGLVTLPKETADKLDAAVSTPEGLAGGEDLTKVTRIATDTTTAGGGSNTDGEKVIQVDMTINVNGATDPMAVSNRVVSEISRGLESAIGGQVRST